MVKPISERRSCLLPENVNKFFFYRKHSLICDLLFAYENFCNYEQKYNFKVGFEIYPLTSDS